jgi:hypothetical protein
LKAPIVNNKHLKYQPKGRLIYTLYLLVMDHENKSGTVVLVLYGHPFSHEKIVMEEHRPFLMGDNLIY